MKEATGELNMTVITVVAIAAIAAIFSIFILPIIRENIKARTYCSSAVCTGCTIDSEGVRKCTNCVYKDENGNDGTVECTFTD